MESLAFCPCSQSGRRTEHCWGLKPWCFERAPQGHRFVSPSSVFQQHAPHYDEARAGSVAFAEIGVSPGERGHWTCSPPRMRLRILQSALFWYPKKDGGLRPVLDLHLLNHTLPIYMFKMLTHKLNMSQIQSEDWFILINLKDAYFNILYTWSIWGSPLGVETYQYRVLPFSLALSLQTFTKWVDEALAPLWLQGILVLNRHQWLAHSSPVTRDGG